MIASAVVTAARPIASPLGSRLAAYCAAGIRFRISGADLIVDGAGALAPTAREALQDDLDLIREQLEPAPPRDDVLGDLGVALELIEDEARAREVIAGLPSTVGFDIETEARPEHAPPPRWLKITKQGRLAKVQPANNDTAGLDPHRGRPRLAQIYDRDAETVYVLDLHHVPLEALEGLWSRSLIIHNAAFEISMLHGRPRRTVCTMQLAGLVFGTHSGGRALANAVEKVLELPMPKDLQASDWSAAHLSDAQLAYAGFDAVATRLVADRLYKAIGPEARPAFKAQNAAVPVIARMRLLGLPLDREILRAQIAAWEVEQVEARAAFEVTTGRPVPPSGPQRARWLQQRLEALGDEGGRCLRGWPRTSTGALKTGAEHLERIAEHDWVRPLVLAARADQRLSSYGQTLLEKISPATGRIHGDFKPCSQKSGRTSCAEPNLLGLPIDARRAVVAPEGRLFVVGDLSQVEMRVAAGLSGDPVMRQAFAEGRDLHWMTGARTLGIANPEALAAAAKAIKSGAQPWLEAATATGQREVDVLAAVRCVFGKAVGPAWAPGPGEAAALARIRQTAKPTNFGGGLYGMGAKGLRGSIWAKSGIDLSLDQAAASLDAMRAAYPVLMEWQQRQVAAAHWPGVLRSKLGRPLCRDWEYGGQIRRSLALNFPVQSSACDVLLVALAKAAGALAERDAEILLQVHDEIVVEADEAVADEAAARLAEAMTAAWVEVFPGEPADGIVDVKIVRCWADAKD